jgi:hypothetical protein
MQQSVVTKSMNGVQLVKKLGQNLKVPSTKISSAELVKNSKLEEQEKIIKPDGSSFVHNQRCLERAKETELNMPLYNLASIVQAKLPDWIIINLWGTVSLPGQICK